MLKAKSLATKYKLHGGKTIEETLFVVYREMLFNSIKCSLLFFIWLPDICQLLVDLSDNNNNKHLRHSRHIYSSIACTFCEVHVCKVKGRSSRGSIIYFGYQMTFTYWL